jgi:ATP-dependent DNA helicase RecG
MRELEQPLTSLSGIGAQTANRLKKLGIDTLQDLIFHLPYRYEDRTRLTPIADLDAGMSALICGKIDFVDHLPKRRQSLICRISDATGFIDIKFFHYTAKQLTMLQPGKVLSCYADIRQGYSGLEIIHPDYRIIDDLGDPVTENCLTAVYSLTEGLSQNTVRKAVKQTLGIWLRRPHALIDWLPEPLLSRYGFPDLTEALQTLHAPTINRASADWQNKHSSCLKRLAFEEMLSHCLSQQAARLALRSYQAPVLAGDKDVAEQFLHELTFSLTAAQQRVIAELKQDCQKPQPMMRLIQGDVGSGKTIVAGYAALLAFTSGYQAAVMAPTELLAEQHFRNFSQWFKNFAKKIVFFTGQIKNRARLQALDAIADGSADIIIGTHALFQEQVQFFRLGLIIIDEQHRFGVLQRMALQKKGQTETLKPHQLIMTATPIPRTLAMLRYSDLDISVIDELPPGRKPVITRIIPSSRRSEIIHRIANWVSANKQAYWVCTLIEESELLQCEAAENTALLLHQALPGVRIGLLHGQLSSAEKDTVMQAFTAHQLDLLVATTVIEVGVDVPNAGLMVIENAERLGLSQLHQLRGRVGRGKQTSYCLLLYQAPLSDIARQRLAILRDHHDGFVIAEKDLALRGPGELMGTRQTGLVQFKVADLDRDADLVDHLQASADFIFQHSPEAVKPLIKRWLKPSANYSEV